uniref:Uncharacterized protein n=1 Tax=viral metagenome TaxID=1070528 RepID=A0A6C0BZS5_9ZZZZ
MSGGSTNINDLPVSNSSGPPPGVQLRTTENQEINNSAQMLNEQRAAEDNSQSRVAPPNPNDYMKQVISDVQNVAQSGGLKLPDGDIPRTQGHITQDKESSVDYVPKGPDDYIKQYPSVDEIKQVHVKKEKQVEKYDYLYDELHGPALISLLYFIFQLPAVHKVILKNIPGLFKNDGNMNTKGYIFNSILFGSVYYLSTKGIEYISV